MICRIISSLKVLIFYPVLAILEQSTSIILLSQHIFPRKFHALSLCAVQNVCDFASTRQIIIFVIVHHTFIREYFLNPNRMTDCFWSPVLWILRVLSIIFNFSRYISKYLYLLLTYKIWFLSIAYSKTRQMFLNF